MKATPTLLPATKTPIISSTTLPETYEPEDSAALLEYLHLLSLSSPRVQASDSIDPYLSRYEVPEFGEGGGTEVRNLVKLRWNGFIAPLFVRGVFLDARKRFLGGEGKGEAKREMWFAMNASGFGGFGGGGPAYSVLQVGAKETLGWVCD